MACHYGFNTSCCDDKAPCRMSNLRNRCVVVSNLMVQTHNREFLVGMHLNNFVQCLSINLSLCGKTNMHLSCRVRIALKSVVVVSNSGPDT